MIILTIRGDKPEAELALFDDRQKLGEIIWLAHRTLADTIHLKIEELLKSCSYTWQDIGGIVCFRGPGSFTGLRISLTVANAMAYGLKIPILSAKGKKWQADGIKRLLAGENETIAVPEYGSEPHTTLK